MKLLLVGDSWAHKNLARAIVDSCGCEIALSRHPGVRTSVIARIARIEPGCDVGVVVAGANDSEGRAGAKEYALGMMAIAHRVAESGAVPFLLELPRVTPPPLMRLRSKVKLWLLRWIRDGGRPDPTEHYREALRAVCHWSIIPCPDFPYECWRDHKHINDDGRLILAKAIVADIPMRREAMLL